MSSIGGSILSVDFARTWLVSQAGGVGAIHYSTINAVIDAIKALPLGEQPSQAAPHVITVQSGEYLEFVWLPDWVWLKSSSPLVATIRGEVGSGTNKTILSVGLGGAQDLVIGAITNPDATAGVFSRNATSAFSDEEGDFGTISNGDTLIVTPEGLAQETFTFAGTETTAQNVVDLIETTAVNVVASVRFGRLELIPAANPGTLGLLIHKEGTVNAALGFSMTVDLDTSLDGTEIQLLFGLIIVLKAVDGLLFSDRSGNNAIHITDRPIIVGCSNAAIHVEDECGLSVGSPQIILNANGIIQEANSRVEIDGGQATGNFTQDVVLAASSLLIARNFTYAKRSGTGILIPSGTRLSFVWEVVGVLGTGTFIDGGRVMPFDMTVESVSMWRGVAGISGDLIVDLNTAGAGGSPVTLYTTQANRPTISSTTDNDTVLADLPDILALSQGDFLSIDIDTVQVGLSQHMNIIVTAVVN